MAYKVDYKTCKEIKTEQLILRLKFVLLLLLGVLPYQCKNNAADTIKLIDMIIFESPINPQQKFINDTADIVISACKNMPLFPSVCMAQLILESGWGKHHAGGANNYFGIKATGKTTPYWTGESTKADTLEVINGKTIKIKDGFRKYANMEQSIKDRNHLLTMNKRYAKALTMTTAEEQIKEIHRAGYATDPQYSFKIINMIYKYKLKKLDEKI